LGGAPDCGNETPCANANRAASFRIVFCCTFSPFKHDRHSKYYKPRAMI
jgi:hypothetical protein